MLEKIMRLSRTVGICALLIRDSHLFHYAFLLKKISPIWHSNRLCNFNLCIFFSILLLYISNQEYLLNHSVLSKHTHTFFLEADLCKLQLKIISFYSLKSIKYRKHGKRTQF